MLPDRVSNPGPLTYESGALPIALRGPAKVNGYTFRENNSAMYSFVPPFPVGIKTKESISPQEQILS